MVRIKRDENDRVYEVDTDWLDSLLGNTVGETKDLFIISNHGIFGIGRSSKVIMKSRVTRSYNYNESKRTSDDKLEIRGLGDGTVTIGGKKYKLSDLSDEVVLKLIKGNG